MVVTDFISGSLIDVLFVVYVSLIIGVSISLKIVLHGVELFVELLISSLDREFLGGVVAFFRHFVGSLLKHVEFGVDFKLSVELKEIALDFGGHDGENA